MVGPAMARHDARVSPGHHLSTVDGRLWPGGVHRGRRPAGAFLRLAQAPPPELRQREHDVLELLAEGNSTREIAQQLCYSERTIKNVVQDITTRLRVRNRTQAVAYAVRHGWI